MLPIKAFFSIHLCLALGCPAFTADRICGYQKSPVISRRVFVNMSAGTGMRFLFLL